MQLKTERAGAVQQACVWIQAVLPGACYKKIAL